MTSMEEMINELQAEKDELVEKLQLVGEELGNSAEKVEKINEQLMKTEINELLEENQRLMTYLF